MKPIDLDEILRREWHVDADEDLQLAVTLSPDVKYIKSAMLEGIRQALERAANNAEVDFGEGEFKQNITVSKDSITSVINDIK